MSQTAELLDGLASYFRRFVVLSDDQLAALVLWTAHTYVYEIADTTPYLIVTSAEKRSGKTRVIEAVQHVAHKPQTVTALTGPVLFRIVSQHRPTLLIDETDAIFKDSRGGPSDRQEELRSILNAGYRRGTLVPRVMPNHQIEWFEVFGPKLLAGIGHLPETVEDRGVNLRLTRKRPEDEVERFRFREVANGTTHALRTALEEWAPGARLALTGRYPTMPDALDDRAQDSYEILIALADFAGDSWGSSAREALVSLRTENVIERESHGVRLLKDLRLFATQLARMERIATVDLLSWLYREGEQPWEEWWGGSDSKKAARRLALSLGEYGLKPGQFKEDGEKKRGYEVGAILEALERYTENDTVHTVPGEESGLTMRVSGGTVLDSEGGSGTVLESADLQGSTVSTVSDAESPLFLLEKPVEDWPW